MGDDTSPIADMTADELRHIARKLTTYAAIYTGDKEARGMAARCLEIAGALDATTVIRASSAAPLVEFLKWAMEGPWCGNDLDGGDVQAKALELGLIVETKYDPEIHGRGESSEYVEKGDQWFVLADWIKTPPSSPDSDGVKP